MYCGGQGIYTAYLAREWQRACPLAGLRVEERERVHDLRVALRALVGKAERAARFGAVPGAQQREAVVVVHARALGHERRGAAE